MKSWDKLEGQPEQKMWMLYEVWFVYDDFIPHLLVSQSYDAVGGIPAKTKWKGG